MGEIKPEITAAPSPTQLDRAENPRVRFARTELNRALSALERVDEEGFANEMRMLYLEEQLQDAWQVAAEWRRSYEVLLRLFTCHGSNPPAEAIDEAVRELVGRA